MKKYGLIGKSLSHSFSKDFFIKFFEENKVYASYANIEIDKIQFISEVFEQNYDGLNVTIPYKETIIPYIDELSVEATEIGAVNVIEFVNGKRIGHNTDSYGFLQAIKPFLANQHERAMIIGTGGGAKAVSFALKSLGIESIFISRHPKFDNEFLHSQVNDNMVNACKLIVNCTPVGMFPHTDDCIDLPYEMLTDKHLVIDLIYNPRKTELLNRAEKSGAIILNGESMLVHQALKAWDIWDKSCKN